MTSIRLRDEDIAACDVRCWDVWTAMDAYRDVLAGSTVAEIAGGGDRAYHLRRVALETVLAERMRIRAVINLHRALLAGAPVGEIAHLLGVDPAEVAHRWHGWADAQRELNARCPGLGVGARDYARVAAALAAATCGQGVEDGFVGRCACRDRDTQIDSPRP